MEYRRLQVYNGTKEAKINGAGNIKYKTKMCDFFLLCIHILLRINCVKSLVFFFNLILNLVFEI